MMMAMVVGECEPSLVFLLNPVSLRSPDPFYHSTCLQSLIFALIDI